MSFEKSLDVRQGEVASNKSDPSTTDMHVPKNIEDADEAMKIAGQQEAPIEIDEATNRRLLKKIDWMLMPLLCVVYALQFLDKTTLSYSSVMGIQQDLALTGDNYQWLGSIFYFGYLVWEYPAALLLQRMPMAKNTAFNIVAWGAALCCFAALKNFAGFMVARFFLGALEASVTPAFTLISAQWYTKSEQCARVAYWGSFNGVAQVVGGLIAYGIARGEARHGYSINAWQIVFVLCGLFTVVVGIVFYFVVPDSQLNARWLSEDDRRLAVERVRVNQQGIGNKHFKFYQFKEAMLDPITWAIVFMALVADIPNGGLQNFFNLLLVSFGFTREESLLYGAPAGGAVVLSLCSWGWITQRYGNRLLFATGGMTLALIGSLLIVALPNSNRGGRLAGFYLTQAFLVAFVSTLSMISSNVAGYTKKTTVAAAFFIFYCVGNIIGPQTYRPEHHPDYVPAKITLVVCYALAIADVLFMYFYYKRLNRKKEAVRAQASYKKLLNQEFMDLTDWENNEFVYVL